jgi:drug/metabolite transporter (DMT)-like permease
MGFITFNLGLLSADNSLPIVVTLSGMVGVVTIELARIFYHEKLEPVQLLGVLIIFVGVGTVSYY